ncbi:PAS domain-containing protein [Ferrovibrio sp.]|uniref:PAS domain-containing protein n=1 Tax=Ferrovibrio sp. TaxID=1917215 RepID=UPI001B433852|nr:PAS domain-containing protein [Ferrovibrio sp.]MBP7063038.1 PAS domain-containing protein [Ferrovibrio sp.]
MQRPTPVDRERHFGEDEIIVSKTDPAGKITYANDVFCKIGAFTVEELIGKPHSILRHPDMPRAVFRLLWERIKAGEEIFAYVKNLAKTGEYYWVFAHVTPSFGPGRQITGYHSNRRAPHRSALAQIEPIYRALLQEEARHADRKAAVDAGYAMLMQHLAKAGVSYDEFVFSITPEN